MKLEPSRSGAQVSYVDVDSFVCTWTEDEFDFMYEEEKKCQQ